MLKVYCRLFYSFILKAYVEIFLVSDVFVVEHARYAVKGKDIAILSSDRMLFKLKACPSNDLLKISKLVFIIAYSCIWITYITSGSESDQRSQ